jgi:hypothetical protein
MKTRFIKRMFLFFILNLASIYNFSIDDLNNPAMFQDEICSYNGVPDPSKSNNKWIDCICQDEYTTFYLSSKIYINNVPVQCNYQKKRRYIALFLAIFLPFGMDYLYLGYYWLSAIIFFLCWFTLIGNCVRFAVTTHIDYMKNKRNLFFVIMGILMIFWWTINIILIWTGIMTDGNGIQTVNDMYYLININKS